ncbi:hypothetical protein COCSADRAFT_26695 [Bipolaris sorokiniana ND90Pr]|uniref:Uncharacterized protein n=1 Tax=Cochliobolus sativus (strain ND90Pr / ATCC 201652) TaxID=665912 RepID=M2T6G9_COCSN|nr:uncharacterized protein COCSADRAFT_26695 [Bipolaris sorokiniana ND90Pr]EMD64557.1 hypothetical protein COCSADRAFT_26695 [Bipolaris sorokiniana ND90Pr]
MCEYVCTCECVDVVQYVEKPIHAASTISQALRHSLHAFAATAIGQVAAKNPNPHGHLGDAPRRYQLERDRGGVSRASGLTPNLLPSHTLCSLFTVSAWHRRLTSPSLDARVFLGPGEHGHENLRLDVHCRNGGYRRASSTDPQPACRASRNHVSGEFPGRIAIVMIYAPACIGVEITKLDFDPASGYTCRVHPAPAPAPAPACYTTRSRTRKYLLPSRRAEHAHTPVSHVSHTSGYIGATAKRPTTTAQHSTAHSSCLPSKDKDKACLTLLSNLTPVYYSDSC